MTPRLGEKQQIEMNTGDQEQTESDYESLLVSYLGMRMGACLVDKMKEMPFLKRPIKC